MVGNNDIVVELRRLAIAQRLTHGYLFFGPEGIGKCLAAQEFAEYLEYGNVDESQKRVLGDSMLVGLDSERKIGIDAVREIKNFLWQTPNKSSRRTVILNDSEYLTPEAQNALLKVTEEPPADSLLILIARDPEMIEPTLSSRVTKIYFAPTNIQEVTEWLKKNKKVKEPEAKRLAELAHGRIGLAARLHENEALKKQYAIAEKLLETKASRSEMIKKVIEPDDFSLPAFLDILISILSSEARKHVRSRELWHKLLALRAESARLNLNPRIQLENLFSLV